MPVPQIPALHKTDGTLSVSAPLSPVHRVCSETSVLQPSSSDLSCIYHQIADLGSPLYGLILILSSGLERDKAPHRAGGKAVRKAEGGHSVPRVPPLPAWVLGDDADDKSDPSSWRH